MTPSSSMQQKYRDRTRAALAQLARAVLPVPGLLALGAIITRLQDWSTAWPIGLALAALLAFSIQVQRHLQIGVLFLTDRIGNVLSRYFERGAVAAQDGKILAILPVPANSWRREIWLSSLPMLSPRRGLDGQPAMRTRYGKHAHERPDALFCHDLPHIRSLIQDCFSDLTLPEDRTCTIHLRLGDVLSEGHRLYGHAPFGWYLEHIPDDCEQIRLVATAGAPEEREVLDALRAFLGEHLVAKVKLQAGSINEDFRALMECHVFIGSVSTFALWAAVGCLGRAVLPQSPLFFGGETRLLREDPRLDIAAVELIGAYALRRSDDRIASLRK